MLQHNCLGDDSWKLEHRKESWGQKHNGVERMMKYGLLLTNSWNTGLLDPDWRPEHNWRLGSSWKLKCRWRELKYNCWELKHS